jgi:hypothetical protein
MTGRLVDLDAVSPRDLREIAGAIELRDGVERNGWQADVDAANAKADPETEDAFDAQMTGRPALGAFPRRTDLTVPTAEEWIAEDPRRLAGVVAEMSRFTGDEVRVAEAAAGLARTLGIDEDVAVECIAQGLRRARGGRRVG